MNAKRSGFARTLLVYPHSCTFPHLSAGKGATILRSTACPSVRGEDEALLVMSSHNEGVPMLRGSDFTNSPGSKSAGQSRPVLMILQHLRPCLSCAPQSVTALRIR